MGVLDDIASAGKSALGGLWSDAKKLPLVGGILSGPAKVDTSPATTANQGFLSHADAFDRQRQYVAGGNGVQVNQGQIDPVRQQQMQAIAGLTAAANGTTPSAAQLQGQQQSQQAAAQQFGIASALQGRSPGAALNSALNGAAGIQGNAIANNAALRANEQATARGQLVQGLGDVRGQEQGLAGANANLNLDQQKMLLAAQLQNQGYSAEMIKAILGGNTAQAAGTNAFNGSILGAGGTAAGLLSDRREKTDVRSANLGTLADALKGFRYRYKNAANGEGERVGIMAQDALEGGPAGKKLVNLDGDGKLRIDVGNAVGAALAMSAEAHRLARGKN